MVDKDFPISIKGSSHGNIWGRKRSMVTLRRRVDKLHTQL